jgi:uncharacterized protein YfbU (UPF0304 family)
MKLSRAERWILSNQLRILEALYPDEADGHAATREVLEHGYEMHYGWVAEQVYEETFSEDRCREVLDILGMFEALQLSYDKLPDKSGIDAHGVRFMGFDGNNETSELAYSDFFCSRHRGGGAFKDVVKGGVPNSHMPTLDIYRRMLAVWREVRKADDLTLSKDDIIKVTEARIHPSNRK